MFFYPFPYSVDNGSVVTAQTTTTSTGRWAKVSASAELWGALAGHQNRFERLYTQPALTFGTHINFAHRIQTQFPTRILTGGQVLISSTITNP